MRLSLRIRKITLAISATSLCCAATAVALYGFQPLKMQLKPRNGSPLPRLSTAQVDAIRYEPTLADFEKLSDLALRRPLYDPPPPKVEVKQLPPLQIELLGTVIEPENSLAIIRSEQGSIAYKRVGDSLGPDGSAANIQEIEQDSIILKREEERITIRVKSNEAQR